MIVLICSTVLIRSQQPPFFRVLNFSSHPIKLLPHPTPHFDVLHSASPAPSMTDSSRSAGASGFSQQRSAVRSLGHAQGRQRNSHSLTATLNTPWPHTEPVILVSCWWQSKISGLTANNVSTGHSDLEELSCHHGDVGLLLLLQLLMRLLKSPRLGLW